MNGSRFATIALALSIGLSAGCTAIPPRSDYASKSWDREVTLVDHQIDAIDTSPTVATSVVPSDGVPSDGSSQSTTPCNTPDLPCRPTFADDWDRLPGEFLSDFESIWTRHNVCVLLVAAGASLAVHETIDNDVAANTGRHPNRWGKGQEFFAGISNPGHHFAAIAGLYLYSLHAEDLHAHDLSKTLFNAISITGLSTIFLKATVGGHSEAPNHESDPFGGAWPSGHTSSVFAFAAVLDEYYGHKVGIPAFILAGLGGWERIDDREHDLSDVIFGAALGYVIGKSVAGEHLTRWCGLELQPFVDPQSGTSGIALERRF